MSAKYAVVPWSNSTEWYKVYDDIFSENSTKPDALNLLQIWKARSPLLPSGIESTLCLLQVHCQDFLNDANVAQEHILRLAYSTAIMRFVNHMLDTETAKGTSLYQAAKNSGVPDWIVDLRHDTAHNNSLPTLELLRNACHISLQWLKENYWDKHKEFISDYKCGDDKLNNNDEAKIGALVNFLSCLGICKQAKIKKVIQIPDVEMQESIVNDARLLLDNIIDFSNLNNVSISSLLNLLENNMKKYLKSKNINILFNSSILGEDSLFLSLELVDLLSKKDFKKKKLSRNYVQCFEPLLTILHTHDLILEFVIALVDITKEDDCPDKALLAALWISEILIALKASKQYLERARKMSTVGTISNKKKELKLSYYHWFPNEKNTFILDLQKQVPSKLTDINFIKSIISSYNPYLTYFVQDLLILVEPRLSKTVSHKICQLTKLISATDNLPVTFNPAKIYTVDDVKMKVDVEISDEDEVVGTEDAISSEVIEGVWKIASKRLDWSICPIGLIPQQTNTPMDFE